MTLRSRSLGGLRPIQVTYAWWTTGEGAYDPTWISGTYDERIGSRTHMTDVVTPNFRKLLSEGRIINNAMSKTELSVTGGDPGWKFQRTKSTSVDYGEWNGPWALAIFGVPAQPPTDSDLVELLTNLANTKAHAGVTSPAVYGQVMIAEMRKTVAMLRNPLRGLTSFISNSRQWEKYKGRKPRGSTKNRVARNRTTGESLRDGRNAAANCWLEARFGWRPFLMEMESILDTLRYGDFGDRKTSRAKQERVVQSTQSYTGVHAHIETDFTENIKSYYKVRSGIMYQFQNTPQSDFGFRWSDVPISAWELIPFSFVVDWFVNVGDYIQALTPKSGVVYLAAWHTISIQHEVERHAGAARMQAPGWVTQRNPVGVDRAVYRTTIRSPNVPPPRLALELDITHALRNNRGWDALGLLTSLLTGDKSSRRALRT